MEHRGGIVGARRRAAASTGGARRTFRLSATRRGQGAELHRVQEAHQRLGIRFAAPPARPAPKSSGVSQSSCTSRLRDADLVGIVDQGLAALVLLDLARAGQQRFQIAVFLDQQRGGLDADARRARHVVDAESPASACTSTTRSGRTPNFSSTSATPMALVLHRVEHLDPVAHQLHQVLVGRDDRHPPARLARLAGKGGDDVVGLEPFGLDAGDVEGARRLARQGELRAQVFGQLGAVGLVGGVDVVAEGLGRNGRRSPRHGWACRPSCCSRHSGTACCRSPRRRRWAGRRTCASAAAGRDRRGR